MLTKHWRKATIFLVFIALLTIIGIKEIGLTQKTEQIVQEASVLQVQLEALYASDAPFVVMFHLEPSSFCCEGTRYMYEDMRRNVENLAARLEGVCPHILIYINALNSEDLKVLHALSKKYEIRDYESAIVIGADGEKLKIFGPQFIISDVVEYARKVSG